MSIHTKRGTRQSLWVADDYGNLSRITFAQLITRIQAGWGEL
jgi:hypothetical protein